MDIKAIITKDYTSEAKKACPKVELIKALRVCFPKLTLIQARDLAEELYKEIPPLLA